MKNIVSFFLILISINYVTATAQEDFRARFSGKATIEGKPVDSISFTLIPEYICHNLNSRTLTFACDSTGAFDVVIPLKSEIEQLTLSIHGAKAMYFSSQYIENGDEIVMQFDGTSKFGVFSGNGAAKLNCIEELNYNRSFEHLSKLYKDTLYNQDLELPISRERKILGKPRVEYLETKDMKIIKNYSQNISKKALAIINENMDATYKKGRIELLPLFYFERKDGVRDEWLRWYFYDNLEFLEEMNTDPDIKVLSQKQIEFLFYLSRAKLQFEKDTYRVSIKEIYDQLVADYEGKIQEKVITYYLLRNPRGDTSEYGICLKDAITRVNSPIAKQFLQQRLDASASKARLHELAMSDSTGQRWIVDDFKGKVVLIDFWFTGCVPCLQLAKTIHDEVVPVFANEPNVVFLTINLDKKQDEWMRSLAEGKYTNHLSVNLWTEGKAFEHPFIKYYGIRGAPVLFLIDKDGTLISANMSRDPDKIIDMIKKHL